MEPRCPDCGEKMQDELKRTSVDSKSAVKIRCIGNETSFHIFTVRALSEFGQFFKNQKESNIAAKASEFKKGITA